MRKLTQLAVDRMRPDPTKRIEISDDLLPALRLVVQPTGARSWAVRTRINGRTAKITLGDARVLDLAKARAAARAKLAEIAEGADPRAEKRRAKATRLGEIAELYLRDRAGETRRNTQVNRQRYLRRDWQPFHDRPLGRITRREIAEHLAVLKDRHGGIAANRSRATLHALFQWALDNDLVEANPVAATRPPVRKERSRDRVLSLDELRQLWAATSGAGDYDAIVRLLMLSGQRREEVAAMRWSEVDLPRRTWQIPSERTKNGKAHIVPLSRPMVEILEGRPRAGRDLVFGSGPTGFGGFSRAKRSLDQRCRLATPWRLHDLRRSLVTHLNEIGIPPAVIEAMINHQSGVKAGVAGVYNRAEHLPERARVMQLWADRLTGAPGNLDNVVALAAAG
jgi:integrase